MHTVDESSDPAVSFVELSPSNDCVCRDSALDGDAETPSPRVTTRTIAFDQTLRPSGNNTKILFGTAVPAVSSPPVPTWKRILDIAFIVLTMPFWLPVMIFLAVWIKLASPGPIFFRQERVGFRGKRFMILKFRTMKVNVETQSHERHLDQLIHGNRPMTKLDNAGDPRIIRGGRVLRALGLDELPQLFNVFRGEMSLVGPRPCTPHEYGRYQVWQQDRVNAPPGLTGYWQVNGKNKTTFTEMITMDIFYTKSMSLRLDLKIILKTLPAIVGQVLDARGAGQPAHRANGSSVGQCSQ